MIDDWIGEKIGLGAYAALDRDTLDAYQIEALRRTIKRARKESVWYGAHLSDIDPDRDICKLTDLTKVPFMSAADLTHHGAQMLCVSASSVSRIVTLPTSGTTGIPKRVFFTSKDQELMIDYVRYGLRVMVSPRETFLILMPCERPGSVGDLVRAGLERRDVQVIAFGEPPMDGSRDREVLALIKETGAASLLAAPSTARRLAVRWMADTADRQARQPESVPLKTMLLSSEYVPPEMRVWIEALWGLKVFEHYGMTEMGLGGAMACKAREGYHPREADLFFEIVDPKTGASLPEGAWGEIVFTTLTREAMPLIRYRTGDISCWMPGSCPCGSVLRRLDRVRNRGLGKGSQERVPGDSIC